jgi:hypothetical protein
VDEDAVAVEDDAVVGDIPATGVTPIGVFSCAAEIKINEIQANSAQKKPDRVVVIGCRL